MESTIVISVIVILIIMLFLIGAPDNLTRFIVQSTVKLGIGILFLFFFNVFGGTLGLHIPINLFTIIISGFLGISGVLSLAAVKIFIL